MFKYLFTLTLVLNFLALPAFSAEIVVADGLVVEIELGDGWTVHEEPPDALVKEMALHVAHEPAAANASAEQIERVARKRLMANEAIIYHALSGANLTVDFIPLDPGESPPDSKTLRNSAEYAAQSLENEEDVEDVSWKVTKAQRKGTRGAYQLAAVYKQHDLPVKFLGIVGYVKGFWYFLYYTDHGKDPGTYEKMRTMLDGLMIRLVAD